MKKKIGKKVLITTEGTVVATVCCILNTAQFWDKYSPCILPHNLLVVLKGWVWLGVFYGRETGGSRRSCDAPKGHSR